MPLEIEPQGKMEVLRAQTVEGQITITDFYSASPGTLYRIAVTASEQNTPHWRLASPPEFTTTTDGEIFGAVFHEKKVDPWSFVYVVERIDEGASAPSSGNLVIKWKRRGYVY